MNLVNLPRTVKVTGVGDVTVDSASPATYTAEQV